MMQNLDSSKVDMAQLPSYDPQFLKTLFEQLPCLVWMKDVEGRFLMCNKEFSKFFRVEEIDVLGKTDHELLSKETADQFRLSDIKAMENDGPIWFETWVKPSNSPTKALMETEKICVRDANGQPLGVLGLSHDITEKHQLTEELYANLQKYKALIDTVPEGVVIASQHGQILEVNNKYCERSGYTKEELLVRDLWDLDTAYTQALFTERFEYLKRVGGTIFETEHVRKDGSTWPVEVSISYTDTQNGFLFGFVRDITERKAEQALTAALTTALDNANTSILVADKHFNIVSINKKLEQLFCENEDKIQAVIPEFKADAVVGSNMDIYHKNPAKQRARAAKLTEPMTTELTFPELILDFTLVPIRPDGENLGYVVEWHDLTQLRQAELDSQHARERYQAIFEKTSSGIAVYEPIDDGRDFVFSDYNSTAERIDGISRTQVIGKALTALFPGIEDLGVLQALRDAHKSGKVQELPIAPYYDDRMNKVWRKNTIFRISSGEVVAVYDDLTPLKESEERQAQLAQRLQMATSAANIGVWDFEVSTQKLSWDEQMMEVYGVASDDFHQQIEDWKRHVYPEDLPNAESMFDQALRAATEGRFEGHFRIIRESDSAVRHIIGQGNVIYDSDGHPERMVGVNYDVTPQIEAHEAMEAAMKNAERANHTKSEFLANISHEIRTPLNAIIGMSDLGANETDADVMRSQHIKVYHSGQILLGLINDVLDFSKIEAGELQIEEIPVDIPGMISGIRNMFTDAAAKKGLELDVSVDTQLAPFYLTDETRLRQIITNLISNAIKFTEEGKVRVAVSLSEDKGQSHKLFFRVSDSGIGMTEEQLGKIFNAFSQADSTINRRYGGTGLGLAISQKLAQLLGSESIEVKTKEGQGSVFYFSLTLPISDAPVSPPELDVLSPDIVGSKARTGSILVVEDVAINQEVVRSMLENKGHTVSIAENGLEAVQTIKREKFDLILMDIQMPVMDGYEATKQIRQAGHTTPIIALTAAAMVEDTNKASAAGMNGHLSKPIEQSKLHDTIQKWLALVELTQAQP